MIKNSVVSWRAILGNIAISGIGLLVLCSLFSFGYDDPTLWRYDSAHPNAQNFFGIFGASIAAAHIYFFDVAAFVLAFGFFLLPLLALCNQLKGTFLDRLAGFFLITSAIALANAVRAKVFFVGASAGGVYGQWLLRSANWLVGVPLVPLFAWTLGVMGLVLTLQWAGIFLICMAFKNIQLLFTHRYFQRALSAIAYSVQRIVKTIIAVFDGSLVAQEVKGIVSFEAILEQIELEVSIEPESSITDSELAGNAISAVTIDVESGLELSNAPTINDCNDKISDAEIIEPNEPKKISYEISLGAAFPYQAESQSNKIADSLRQAAQRLEQKLARFGVQGEVVGITPGPVITFFEYKPDIDAKVSKIIALEDDLALALEALSVRIIAPVPGTAVVGFEVANKLRETVRFAQIVHSSQFMQSVTHRLAVALGQDVKGQAVIVDVATMPHVLIAGSTGSGKSGVLNVILASLIAKHGPDTLRLILIDPKRLEFGVYADIPQLLFPVVTEVKQAAAVLKQLVTFMMERYQLMERYGVKSIADFNERYAEFGEEKLPYIVIMVDELADLMMTVGKEVEELIVRIAQMARAAGIHMIVATQRPSVDVITGLLKVNFPTRIACRVASKIDSRTVLDVSGAQKLLGRGDMLLLTSQGSLNRVHGAYVSDQEIVALVAQAKKFGAPDYFVIPSSVPTGYDDGYDMDDELFFKVVQFLPSVEHVSVSLLQRAFRIGYNRSARLVDRLEAEGFIVQEPTSKLRRVVRS